ncbi:hypothetical protein QAD02_019356 [Eretmocerus hayati]|uniref:Uncharacterized protein n=1 Tax=Eretmocerus hayati TaxID=131215 RepID=A0ACC2PJU1_9HYME|nr:hypothetical protein QAD02_019356 [Eretmocerus hayati]
MGDTEQDNTERSDGESNKPEKLFTLKKWNAVAMWSWDVECDTCAICRVQVMGLLNAIPTHYTRQMFPVPTVLKNRNKKSRKNHQKNRYAFYPEFSQLTVDVPF